MRRFMVTYYDEVDSKIKIADVSGENEHSILTQFTADQQVNSIVEVLPGIDFDKENYEASWPDDCPVMRLK